MEGAGRNAGRLDRSVEEHASHPKKQDNYIREDRSSQVAMQKKSRPSEVERHQPNHKEEAFVKNENVMSAIICLMKELNVQELNFLKREANLLIGK